VSTEYAHITAPPKPPKTEIFGTVFRPHARWLCACGRRNVTKLLVPIRAAEPVFCANCRARSTVTVDLAQVPRYWGGSLATT
jgi:hypothetical protein